MCACVRVQDEKEKKCLSAAVAKRRISNTQLWGNLCSGVTIMGYLKEQILCRLSVVYRAVETRLQGLGENAIRNVHYDTNNGSGLEPDLFANVRV